MNLNSNVTPLTNNYILSTRFIKRKWSEYIICSNYNYKYKLLNKLLFIINEYLP